MSDESIQSKGGKARAEKLSPEQLSDDARRAALARWANRPIRALHKGNFLEHFGVDVDCYVLDDANKTAVLSLRGLSKALGFGDDSGSRLKTFLSAKKMIPFAGPELLPRLSQPLVFQWGTGGLKSPPTIVHGFDATVLIDICNVLAEAQKEGVSGTRFERAVKAAAVITGASAKAGIRNLVYALAGYNPSAEEVISAFKAYVQEEAKKYEKEFPNELYEQWQRLYDLKMPERGKPWHFKHLTVNHVYYPLAKSDGKLLKLLREMKASGGKRSDKLFQFLNEVGARAMRMHMGRILEICESSTNKEAYERRIEDRFGNGQLDFFR